MTALRVASVVGLSVVAIGCVRAMFVPPADPGAPAPDAPAAWAAASTACRDARTYVASLRVSGRVAGNRLWPVTIEAAVTSDQSIYLDAHAATQAVFVMAGTANRATLWLRRDNKSVTAAPADILEAVVGVPLSPDRLLAILTGCVARSLEIAGSERHGSLVSVRTADARVHLEQRAGAWRVRAADTSDVVVEFAVKGSLLPAELWIWTAPAKQPPASLHLTVTDPEINGTIPARVFQVPAGAASATPITIEELRAAGPWKN